MFRKPGIAREPEWRLQVTSYLYMPLVLLLRLVAALAGAWGRFEQQVVAAKGRGLS